MSKFCDSPSSTTSTIPAGMSVVERNLLNMTTPNFVPEILPEFRGIFNEINTNVKEESSDVELPTVMYGSLKCKSGCSTKQFPNYKARIIVGRPYFNFVSTGVQSIDEELYNKKREVVHMQLMLDKTTKKFLQLEKAKQLIKAAGKKH